MITYYIKQACELMRQNRLFTSIYVVGTALAVASTMIMVMVYYVKLAPLYPEVNRGRTYFVKRGSFKQKQRDWQNSWAYSYKALQEWFYPLENAEVVSAYYDDYTDHYVQPLDEGSGDYQVKPLFTDPAFFRIYNLRFLEGTAFAQADFDSEQRVAVVSDRFARRQFGTARDVVGQTFSMDYLEYRVVGVVQEPSFLVPGSYAQVYAPYTSLSGYRSGGNEPEYMGQFAVALLTRDNAQAKALRAEVEALAGRYTHSQDEWEWVLSGQPISYYQTVFQRYVEEGFSWSTTLLAYAGVFLILLLVPALNLSGMISGRMEARLAEMGVRKAFGANRRLLLGQVMWENLFLTLLGGAVGMLIAWATLGLFRVELYTLMDDFPTALLPGASASLDASMLFAPSIFGSALLVCLLLNMLSALLPAWHSLRHPIVSSLNEKR